MGLMISCKKATEFISIKEEKKLGLIDSIKLQIHIGICGVCKLFQRQNKIIVSNIGNLHQHISASLSEEEKKKIVAKLEESVS